MRERTGIFLLFAVFLGGGPIALGAYLRWGIPAPERTGEAIGAWGTFGHDTGRFLGLLLILFGIDTLIICFAGLVSGARRPRPPGIDT